MPVALSSSRCSCYWFLTDTSALPSIPSESSQELTARQNPSRQQCCGWNLRAGTAHSFGNERNTSRAELWKSSFQRADLGALQALSQGSSGLDIPIGWPTGPGLWPRCCHASSEKRLSPCSEMETGVTSHGAHVLSRLSLGKGHMPHQIPAETTRVALIRQTGAKFTDTSPRGSQKRLALSPFISTWLCARDSRCSFK